MSEQDEQNYADFLNSVINTESTTATPLPNRSIQMESRVPVASVEPVAAANPVVKHRITSPNLNEIKKVYADDMYEYLNMEELPMFAFYQTGTKIKFRDLKVKEIEDYSALDESNLFDFKEKLHDVLERACIFIHPDGSLGSYADIMDGDKAWIIYTIREKTFPNGRVLSVTVEDRDDMGERVEHTVEIRRENIEIYRDEEIMQWYSPEHRCLVFETTMRDEPFYISPPTVGLKNCFDQYLKIQRENKEVKINGSFFKYAPYLQPGITEMSYEELVEFENWFSNDMTPIEYSFLYDIFENYLYLGIRGLKKRWELDSSEPIRFTPIVPSLFLCFQMPLDYFVNNKLYMYGIGMDGRTIDTMPFWKFQMHIDVINQQNDAKAAKSSEKLSL